MQNPQVSAKSTENASGTQQNDSSPNLPAITLPKGGGAIRGIGEKFAANPVTGTGSMSVPITTSPGRSGFGPQLSLSYDSGAGNGPFGFGWSLSLPSITRKTDKGLPQYRDEDESDVFILSGSEDLVPVLKKEEDDWVRECFERRVNGVAYAIQRYRPRIEGLFARIERWTNLQNAESHWRSISKDNITTLYGKTAESRIADPANPAHVFTWLICQSHDDKGNVITYEYKPDDSVGIDLQQAHEQNRPNLSRSANRYLKHIRYGNCTPFFPNHDPTATPTSVPSDWMFEVVFDYNEHDHDAPAPQDAGTWDCRNDPFSHYRAGFEVRTYRLCQRVLMFHHFPDEKEVGADCLVRSTDFNYSQEVKPTDARNPIFSFLISVSQSGYRRVENAGYLKKSLPPLEFTYSEAAIQEELREVDPETMANLPYGLDNTRYQWVDLDGEGLPGILTEQGHGWFYKRNLSPINIVSTNGTNRTEPRFSPVELVPTAPVAGLGSGAQFMDLAGDGTLDLVQFSGPVPGFYERTDDEQWEPFAPFESLPKINWADPNLKFIDLTGDGHADILISEDNVFCWHPSLAEAGFGARERVSQAFDEENGPRLIFADQTETIYLADMTGDGLTDIARIRNGEVCYWPNIGYGSFGAKVTTDNAPWFDLPDRFNHQRIRLADIDGSGTNDIIYLSADGVRLYFNQSGNSWSQAVALRSFPRIDNVASVTVADLLGNGTACLVWSSPLIGNTRRPMRYVDLMGGQKPHLLLKTVNNLGAETVVTYASSARFYLEDKLGGKSWITKLPFPVHVVERVETFDYVSRNRFVTRYAHHHGYFDGKEREFRGFGMVEQWDTEELVALQAGGTPTEPTNINESSYVPPTYTKTWFHTGVCLGRNHVSDFFAGLLNSEDQGEYYREPGLTDAKARELLLDDTVLPDGLTAHEQREACRALKGAMLRQEVYIFDCSQKEEIPFSVIEQNFTIQQLQSRESNRHAVFFTHTREAVSYHYERNPADPRTTHKLTLEIDAFGNVLKETAVGYGRRQPDMSLALSAQMQQTQTLITYRENTVTHSIEAADDYRTPLPAEARTYELTGLTLPPNRSRFNLGEMITAEDSAVPIAYEQNAISGVMQKRLIEHTRTLYRLNNLTGALPLGDMQSLALLFESYKLAFTTGLVTSIYGTRVTGAMLESEGRYVHSEGDTDWWIPSGRIFYSSGSTDTPAQELAYARQHFFLPHRYRDPFHTSAVPTENFVTYDTHNLLILETRDALGNRVTVGERDATGNLAISGNDYRMLQPRLMMDSNRNRTSLAFDALGMVVGTAVMGKPFPATMEGDTLIGFEPDLTDAVILNHLADPFVNSQGILQRATTRLLYDLFAYHRTKNQPNPQPPAVYTLARVTHDSDAVPVGGLKTQHSFSYSDGFGREVQKKLQAEAGPVPKRDTSGRIIVDPNDVPEMILSDVSPRWVGSGWMVFNNKGKPVRQYEPFFTDTHRFEFDPRIGVSPVLFYDSVERLIATLHPNHTYEKVVFDPWQQSTWDVNDTVLRTNPTTDADVSDFFRRLPNAEYLPTWHEARASGAKGPQEQEAADKSALHSNTPSIAYFDALGRPFLTIANNGPALTEKYATRVNLDVEGNQRELIDAKDRIVMRYAYDLRGNRVHQLSMDAGARWILNDVTGNSVRAWDSRGHAFRTEYDPLRRPLRSFVTSADPCDPDSELLAERLVYGEQHPEGELHNLRAKLYLHLDQAGAMTNEARDFKGNPRRASRRITKDYKQVINWNAVNAVLPTDVSEKLDPAILEAALAPRLEADIYTSHTTYDALNRTITLTTPHTPSMRPSVIRHSYNDANLLERIDANLPAGAANDQPIWIPFVTNIDYDAKGQRRRIDYGNGASTFYDYDPVTFRLIHLRTRRNAVAFPGDCPQPPPAGWPGCQLQDLCYTYDPVGNITHIRDQAQQTVYFRNKRVEPSAEYTYDAMYRLIEAKGREHLGQIGGAPIPHSHDDVHRVGLDWSANDGNAMGTYIERYVYDAVGNFLKMQHRGSDPVHPGWTRSYDYGEPSLIENGAGGVPLKTSNRLSSTRVGNGSPITERYVYDVHGNMTRMPHLGGAHPGSNMYWDYRDQLRQTDLGGGGTAYYVYDMAGQRLRKIWERPTGLIEERICLGGFEIFRRRQGTERFERATLHIMHDSQRIALVETRTVDTAGSDPAPPQLVRYQHGNHLGSANLELDDQARIISYEEYTPYGSTSYQAVRSQTATPKRYRYSGKERDEESGLYYHGARYYAPWLARWTSVDPAMFRLFDRDERTKAGKKLSLNSYEGMANNPITFVDGDGRQTTGYERYLDRQLSTPEGASRITGIPYTPPPPLTPRQAEAVSEGTRLGASYGQFEADLEQFNSTINRKWGGVSLWDKLSESERRTITNNVVAEYNKLPALTEHFSDPAVSGFAQEAFNRTRKSTYANASIGNTIRNLFFELAPFLAAGLISSLISGLRRAGASVVIDLFGGKSSQIAGAINVDIAATSGIRADVTGRLPLATSVADEVIVTNPFISGAPTGSRAANTWLSEAARILKPGGRMTVTGDLGRNKFARMATTAELESMGLKLVEGPHAVSDPRIIAQKMFRTDGAPVNLNELQSYVLEKIK